MMHTPEKLNKSYSESELNKLNLEDLNIQDYNRRNVYFEKNTPVIRRKVVIIEEVYPNNSSLVRCGRSIPNQLHNLKDIQLAALISTDSVNKIISPKDVTSQIQRNEEINSYYDGITPMDVDLICNNLETGDYLREQMDVDTDYDNYKTERLNNLDTILKKRKLDADASIVPKNKSFNSKISPILLEKKKLRCSSFIYFTILISLLTLLYLYCFHGDVIFVNSDIQFQNIRRDLLEKVYEQKGPVNVVIRSLERRNRWADKIKILGFIGPSGVGKTFIANILKMHFHPSLVYELYGLQHNLKNRWETILNRLKSCCLNLIIVDNLNKTDAKLLFKLVSSLPKDHYILVISIFSIQNSDNELNYVINYGDIDEIRHEFDDSLLFHELAVFHQFNKSQVKDWLEKQLQVQNIKYSDKLLDNVLYNHDAAYEGLKGVYSKVLLKVEENH